MRRHVAVLAACSFALLVLPSVASASSPSIRANGIAECHAAHFSSCAGHLTKVGGLTVYEFNQPFIMGANGKLREKTVPTLPCPATSRSTTGDRTSA